MTSPLEKLVASEEELPEQELASVLVDFVRIHPTTGEIIPLQAFNSLTAKGKVLTVLLAAKAAHRLAIRRDKETLSVSEFIKSTGIPKGTVAPMLRQLLEQDRLVMQDNTNKSYLVPTYAVGQAIQFIKNAVAKQGKGGEKS